MFQCTQYNKPTTKKKTEEQYKKFIRFSFTTMLGATAADAATEFYVVLKNVNRKNYIGLFKK